MTPLPEHKLSERSIKFTHHGDVLKECEIEICYEGDWVSGKYVVSIDGMEVSSLPKGMNMDKETYAVARTACAHIYENTLS